MERWGCSRSQALEIGEHGSISIFYRLFGPWALQGTRGVVLLIFRGQVGRAELSVPVWMPVGIKKTPPDYLNFKFALLFTVPLQDLFFMHSHIHTLWLKHSELFCTLLGSRSPSSVWIWFTWRLNVKRSDTVKWPQYCSQMSDCCIAVVHNL